MKSRNTCIIQNITIAILAAVTLTNQSLAADIVLTPPAGGGVAITNAAGNVTRLRVGEDGTVGIGTATPQTKLHAVGTSWFQGDNTPLPPAAGKGIAIGSGGNINYLFAFDYGNFTPQNLLLNHPGGNVGIGTTSPGFLLDVAGRMRVRQSAGGSAGISFYQTTSGTDPALVGMASDTQVGFWGNTGAGWGLVMNTTNGMVGIGTLTPMTASRLEVLGKDINANGVFGNSNSGYGVGGASESGDGVFGISTYSNGVHGKSYNGYAGYFDGNVYVTGTVTQNSDIRLKQGVRNLAYGLHDVMQLRPVSYTWKQTSNGREQLGLLAQEVEAVVPELVTTAHDADQTKGINYIGLLPVMIKAMQEQQDIITALKSENTSLDARLKALEQKLQE